MAGEWQETTLGELTEFLSGGTPAKGCPDFWGGDVPWVSAKDMKHFRLDDTEDHVTKQGVAKCTKLVPAGTVLLLTRGMTLLNDVPICIAGRPMTFNQDIKALRPKPGVRGEFLPYLLLGNKDRLLNLVDLAGHGTGRLNSDELKALDVVLPPEPEQRAIVYILGTLDDKIDLNRRINETLESIARAIFKSWFMDFDPTLVKAQGRDPGLPRVLADLFPDSFEDSVLGEIPRGYGVRTLGACAELMIGGDWGQDLPSDKYPVAVRCLRGVDLHRLQTTGWSDAPLRWVSEESRLKRTLNSCDVLIEGSGECGRSLAYCESLAASYAEPIIYSNFCKRIRLGSPAQAIFVERVLNGMVRSGEMKSFVTGTAMPNLDLKGMLTGLQFVVPAADVLDAFGRLVGAARQRLFSRESRTLAALRDTLLPKLISGELRANDAERIAKEAPV